MRHVDFSVVTGNENSSGSGTDGATGSITDDGASIWSGSVVSSSGCNWIGSTCTDDRGSTDLVEVDAAIGPRADSGHWLVASGGGCSTFGSTFGDAQCSGPMDGQHRNTPVVGGAHPG